MIRHLIAEKSYALTECHLTAAVPDSLVTDLDQMDCPNCRKSLINRGVCPACGENRLVWSAGPVKLNQIADGRLTMRDVETQFYLGCEECSETLKVGISADQVASVLTQVGWRP